MRSNEAATLVFWGKKSCTWQEVIHLSSLPFHYVKSSFEWYKNAPRPKLAMLSEIAPLLLPLPPHLNRAPRYYQGPIIN